MAPRPTEQERKQQLVAALASSRNSIRVDRGQLRQQLNPVLRLRSAVKNKPVPVFAATAAGALLLTLLLRRRPRSSPKSFSAKRMILGWALSLAKPPARVWLLNAARERFLPHPDQGYSSHPDHTP